MATAESFLISYTDLDPNRDFIVAPFTTSGPTNPTDATLDVNSVAARTSLLFYGKGSPNYGDRIQENMLHIMENFSGILEPVYPIPGQLWFDRRTTPTFNWVGTADAPILRVFDPYFHEIVDVDATLNIIRISGNHSELPGGAGPTGRFKSGMVLRIFENPTVSTEERLFSTTGVTYDVTFDRTEISLSGTIDLTFVGRFLGEWVQVQTANVPAPPGGIDAGGSPIINVPTPVNPTDAANKQYVDDQNVLYVDVAGDTMTGFLLLNADPTAALHAATKQYVDTQITAVGDINYVNASGDTMTGFLTLNGDPVNPLHAATMNYVDTRIANHDSEHDDRYLQLTGGTLTGPLFLAANPAGSLEAATKQYVDTRVLGSLGDVNTGAQLAGDILAFNGAEWFAASNSAEAGVLFLTGGSLVGPLTLQSDPISNLQAATKQYVDSEILSAVGGAGSDGVVNGGSYDSGTQELTLTRTLGLPDIVIPGISSVTTSGGTIDDTNIVHVNARERVHNSTGVIYTALGDSANWPQLRVREVLNQMDRQLSVFSAPLAYDQRETSLVDALRRPNGFTVTLETTTRVGWNRTLVFCDGVKQTPRQHNYGRIKQTLIIVGPDTIQPKIFPSTPVSFPTTVGFATFTVTFDPGELPPGPVVVVSIDRDPGVTATFQDICDQINTQISGAGTCHFMQGEMRIYTNNANAYGLVDILDPEPGSAWTEITTAGGVTFTFNIVDTDLVDQALIVEGDCSDIIGVSIANDPDGDDLVVAGTSYGADNTYVANTQVLPVYDPTTNRTTVRLDTAVGPTIPGPGHPSPGTTDGTMSLLPWPLDMDTDFSTFQKVFSRVGGYVEGDGTQEVGEITNEITFFGDTPPPTGHLIEVIALDDPTRDDAF